MRYEATLWDLLIETGFFEDYMPTHLGDYWDEDPGLQFLKDVKLWDIYDFGCDEDGEPSDPWRNERYYEVEQQCEAVGVQLSKIICTKDWDKILYDAQEDYLDYYGGRIDPYLEDKAAGGYY